MLLFLVSLVCGMTWITPVQTPEGFVSHAYCSGFAFVPHRQTHAFLYLWVYFEMGYADLAVYRQQIKSVFVHVR